MGSHIRSNRRKLLAAAGALAASAMLTTPAFARAAPNFVGINGWINSGPLSMSDLRGRPVLINVWARSCIACLNAMPHIKSLYARYKDRGFLVIGVHTPEFAVEKSHAALEVPLRTYLSDRRG